MDKKTCLLAAAMAMLLAATPGQAQRFVSVSKAGGIWSGPLHAAITRVHQAMSAPASDRFYSLLGLIAGGKTPEVLQPLASKVAESVRTPEVLAALSQTELESVLRAAVSGARRQASAELEAAGKDLSAKTLSGRRLLEIRFDLDRLRSYGYAYLDRRQVQAVTELQKTAGERWERTIETRVEAAVRGGAAGWNVKEERVSTIVSAAAPARPERNARHEQVMRRFEQVRDFWLSEAGRSQPGELARDLGREIREFKRLEALFADKDYVGRAALHVQLMTLHVFHAAAKASGETDDLRQTVLVKVERPLEAMGQALAEEKNPSKMSGQAERVAGLYFAQEAQAIHETIVEGLMNEAAGARGSRKLKSKEFVALSGRAISIFERQYGFMAPSQESLRTAVYVLAQMQRAYEAASAKRKTLPAFENLVLPLLLEFNDIMERARRLSDARDLTRRLADVFLREQGRRGVEEG